MNEIKRLLFASHEYHPDVNLATCNTMIYEAGEEAFEALMPDEQKVLEREVQHLMDEIPRLTRTGALELLAAISEFVGGEG